MLRVYSLSWWPVLRMYVRMCRYLHTSGTDVNGKFNLNNTVNTHSSFVAYNFSYGQECPFRDTFHVYHRGLTVGSRTAQIRLPALSCMLESCDWHCWYLSDRYIVLCLNWKYSCECGTSFCLWLSGLQYCGFYCCTWPQWVSMCVLVHPWRNTPVDTHKCVSKL